MPTNPVPPVDQTGRSSLISSDTPQPSANTTPTSTLPPTSRSIWNQNVGGRVAGTLVGLLGGLVGVVPCLGCALISKLCGGSGEAPMKFLSWLASPLRTAFSSASTTAQASTARRIPPTTSGVSSSSIPQTTVPSARSVGTGFVGIGGGPSSVTAPAIVSRTIVDIQQEIGDHIINHFRNMSSAAMTDTHISDWFNALEVRVGEVVDSLPPVEQPPGGSGGGALVSSSFVAAFDRIRNVLGERTELLYAEFAYRLIHLRDASVAWSRIRVGNSNEGTADEVLRGQFEFAILSPTDLAQILKLREEDYKGMQWAAGRSWIMTQISTISAPSVSAPTTPQVQSVNVLPSLPSPPTSTSTPSPSSTEANRRANMVCSQNLAQARQMAFQRPHGIVDLDHVSVPDEPLNEARQEARTRMYDDIQRILTNPEIEGAKIAELLRDAGWEWRDISETMQHVLTSEYSSAEEMLELLNNNGKNHPRVIGLVNALIQHEPSNQRSETLAAWQTAIDRMGEDIRSDCNRWGRDMPVMDMEQVRLTLARYGRGITFT